MPSRRTAGAAHIDSSLTTVLSDPWLGEVLARPVFRLALDTQHVNASQPLREAMAIPRAFIFCKTTCHDVAHSIALQDLGFRLVDTSLTLSKSAQASSPNVEAPLEYELGFASPADEKSAVGVAARSFVFSRFHIDPGFKKRDADGVKAGWVRNFFRGARGDQMVVARAKDGEVKGFLQLLHDRSSGRLTIDLIAVAQEAQKKGVAAALIKYAETRISPVRELLVGTQAANIPSIRLYEKIGFAVCASGYVFHYHQEP